MSHKDTIGNAEKVVKNFQENKDHPLKIILGFYRGEMWTLIKSTIFLTLQNLPVWIIPIVTANIINIATRPDAHTVNDILFNSLLLAVFILQNVGSTYMVSIIYDRLTRKIEYLLRSALIEKLQQLSIMYHKSTNSGKLQSKIMRDCENIELLLASTYRNLFTIIVSVIVAVIVTLKESPIVMLFFIVLIPAELFLLNKLRPSIKQKNKNFRSQVEKAQSNVSEMIDLMPVTRAHGLQYQELNKLSNQFGSVMTKGYELDKSNNLFSASSWVLSHIAQLACLSFTGYLAFRGNISVGEVSLYQTYFNQIVGFLNLLINIYPQIAKGIESINSIGEVLYDDNIEINNSIIPLGDMKGKIDFCDVVYSYADSDKTVLNNFNLSVNPGESIAFVGGSGAGKSTILNLLIGFDKPQEGKILVDNINMDNLDLNEFRKQIAVVPQSTVLFAGSIRDNITYGIDNVTDDELYKTICDVGLLDVIENLPDGIDTHLGEHGDKLSGGQRQRISIARALLRKPKLIIFDEATSALDSESEKKVQFAVDNMMGRCTTFMVAHRLSTVKNADRIAVIKNGAISEIGTYDELMTLGGEFYRLKKLQD